MKTNRKVRVNKKKKQRKNLNNKNYQNPHEKINKELTNGTTKYIEKKNKEKNEMLLLQNIYLQCFIYNLNISHTPLGDGRYLLKAFISLVKKVFPQFNINLKLFQVLHNNI